MASKNLLDKAPKEDNIKEDNNQKDYEYRMIEAFIGNPKTALWYQNAFKEFNVNGVDRLNWKWNWGAFLFGFMFLL